MRWTLPTHGVDCFFGENAADQLVLALAHRVERDAVDAVLQARNYQNN